MAISGTALIAFISYFVAVLGIGIYAARFSSSGIREFFVGGRTMHRWVVALSAVVSGRSAWLLLGFTGLAYLRGASAVWAVVGYIAVEALLFVYYGRRLRRFAGKYDCVTLPDFFAARLGDASGLLRGLLAITMLIFLVPYISAQFTGGGKAFAASFGVSHDAGVWITAGLILAYTMVGGFLAVSLTDVLQAMFMLLALVLLPVVVIASQGGIGAVIDQLGQLDPTLVDPAAITTGGLIGFVGIGLGSPGNPHILTRYMSIRDPAELRAAAVIGTAWNVLMAAGALCIGLAGRAAFPEISHLPDADPEKIYPVLAAQALSPVLFGLVLAAVFAAIMSTADSQLLVAASSVVRDLYEKVIKRGHEVPPRALVLYSRIVVAALVLAALVLGMVAQEWVFWLVLFSWAGLGAALGPTSILALYWRRTTRAGVAAGMVTGAATVIAWRLIPSLKAIVYELVPAFLAGLVVTVVVSLMTRAPDDVDDMFDTLRGQETQ